MSVVDGREQLARVAGVTYVLRHGQTNLSAAHVVNGDPGKPVVLDTVGVRQCAARSQKSAWLDTITVCLTSRFIRTQQTASLLLGQRKVPLVVDPHLDEIDYGAFEAGPWLHYGAWLREHGPAAVPPGSIESWSAATRRLLTGLTGCLRLPGPRLVVGHGLLVSVLQSLRSGDGRWDGMDMPEAAYVDPLVLTDAEIAELAERGRPPLLN